MIVKNICEDCGCLFESRGYAVYCNRCVKRRQSENAKKIGLNKIGHAAFLDRHKVIVNECQ